MAGRMSFVWIVICIQVCSASLYEWTLIPQVGAPTPRFDFAYGFNNATSTFYVFGGQSSLGILGDFYSYNTETGKWTTIKEEGPTPRRDSAGVVFNNLFFIIGGKNSTYVFDEVWAYGEAGWKFVGNFPLALSGGSAVNLFEKQILYFGGITQTATYSPHSYKMDKGSSEWVLQTQPPNPDGRIYFSMAHATSPYNLTSLFGGYSGSFPQLNDLWLLGDTLGSSWQQIGVVGKWPQNRSGHLMVYDPVSESFILFGGENDSSIGENDVWALSLTTHTWTLITPQGSPPHGRLGGGIMYTKYGIVIFGGISGWLPGDEILNDMWILSQVENEINSNETATSC